MDKINLRSYSLPVARSAVGGAPRQHLVGGLVRFYEDVLCREFEPSTGRFRPLDGAAWDIRHHYAIVVPALLYTLADSLNPHRGSKRALAMCVGAADFLAATQDRFGRFPEEGTFCSVEWPGYYLARCCLLLGKAAPAVARRRWLRAAERYAEYHGPKSMITGAANHNAWKCLALHTCGLALGSREWRERGLRGAWQLAASQSPDGFWDEPQRHHGPSIHYLSGVTRPMTLLAMDSGDPAVARMAARARDFLIRFSLPDGGTLGCLDSRAPYSIGQFNAGFATSARGRRLNGLALETQVHRGLGEFVASAGSIHQAHGLAATMADSLPYWRGGPEARLPQEADGYTARFDWGLQSGSLARARGWAVGLSAVIAEVKLRSPLPEDRDLQNRLDVWHPRAGLVVGGGDSHCVRLGGADNMAVLARPDSVLEPAREGKGVVMPVPAPVVLVTGFGDEGRTTCDFGLARSTSPNWIRAMYYPLAARILETGVRNTLRLDFTHGAALVMVEPLDENVLRVRFEVEHEGVPRLLLQLPLVVYDGMTLRPDGAVWENSRAAVRDGRPVRGRVEIAGGADEPLVVVRPPRGWPARVRFPLVGAPGYLRALLSAQRDNPPRRFAAEFRVEVAG